MDDTTLLITYISSFLGAFGALFFIVSYVVFTDLRTKSRRLLLYLSIVDLGQAIRFLTVKIDGYNQYFCTAQSLFGIWVASASFFWTACIAVYVYLVVKNPNRLFPDWGLKLFHILSWGYPTAAVLAILLMDVEATVGSDVPWCFLNPRSRLTWCVSANALFFSC